MVVVNDQVQRRGQLALQFDECREICEDKANNREPEDARKLRKVTRGFKPRQEKKPQHYEVEELRPGRYINCLINLRVSLIKDGEDQKVIDRLTNMYFEACDVVMEFAGN